MDRLSKNWLFTINNPSGDEDEPAIFLQEYASYCVYQLEVGENGTPHYQGYVHLMTKKRFSTMKNICPGAHWEARRGSHSEAKKYCSKDETRSPDGIVVEWGDEPSAGERTDLLDVKLMIDEGETWKAIADEHFGSYVRYHKGFEKYKTLDGKQREAHTYCKVLWGPAGSGKSTRAMYEARLFGEEPYVMPRPQGKVWFDGYDGQKVIILDEFYGWLPFDLLVRMIDQLPLIVEQKGGTVQFLAELIIITSNRQPRDWYKEESVPQDRFQALERRLKGELGEVILMDVVIDHPWEPEEDEEMEEVRRYDSDRDDDDL